MESFISPIPILEVLDGTSMVRGYLCAVLVCHCGVLHLFTGLMYCIEIQDSYSCFAQCRVEIKATEFGFPAFRHFRIRILLSCLLTSYKWNILQEN